VGFIRSGEYKPLTHLSSTFFTHSSGGRDKQPLFSCVADLSAEMLFFSVTEACPKHYAVNRQRDFIFGQERASLAVYRTSAEEPRVRKETL
jgi:hypothetical protein